MKITCFQIDWHNFVVVETVDYQQWEVGNFPPPTNPTEVGARVLIQRRSETTPAASKSKGDKDGGDRQGGGANLQVIYIQMPISINAFINCLNDQHGMGVGLFLTSGCFRKFHFFNETVFSNQGKIYFQVEDMEEESSSDEYEEDSDEDSGLSKPPPAIGKPVMAVGNETILVPHQLL